MGIFDKLLSRKERQEARLPEEPKADNKVVGVCIPEARQKILQEEAMQKRSQEEKQVLLQQRREELLPSYVDEKPRFMVDGIFAVIDTLMVKGRVASGKIQKGNVFIINKRKFKAKDLQFEGRSTSILLRGQTGAIFFDKAKGLTLKAGKVLEFKTK